VGREGVEKRIDVLAMAIQQKGTIGDLEEAELCYAPQYGSAKDPVNIAGMIASNVMDGYISVRHWDALDESKVFILDVRDKEEFDEGHVPNAVNIPLNTLRSRLNQLPKDKEVGVYCFVGQSSYVATRILVQNGFKVSNLSGGFLMYRAVENSGIKESV